jgi:hypothetical protein
LVWRGAAGRGSAGALAATPAAAATAPPSAAGIGAGRGLLRMTAMTRTMPAAAEQAMEMKMSARSLVRNSPDSRKTVATITRRKLTRSTNTPP